MTSSTPDTPTETPTSTLPALTIALTEHEPDALFLRQEVAHGEAPDGTRISVEQAGPRILLRHTTPADEVTLHSFRLDDVVQEWAKQIERRKA